MASGLFQQYSAYYHRANTLYQRPQVKASIEIILSVFTVSLLMLFAIKPTLTNIATLQKKIEDQGVVLIKANQKLGKLIQAEAQLSENRDRLQLFNNAVPSEFNYFNISKRMEILAKENSLNIETMRLPGSVITGKVSLKGLGERVAGIITPSESGGMTIPVNFLITGKQSQILGFLRGINNMDLLGVIKNIKISKRQIAGTQEQELSLDGALEFYSTSVNK